MSYREGVIWREIPAKPGEKPRHVYIVNGRSAAFVGHLTVEGVASNNMIVALAKPFYYTVNGVTALATTLEEAKRLAEEAVWNR